MHNIYTFFLSECQCLLIIISHQRPELGTYGQILWSEPTLNVFFVFSDMFSFRSNFALFFVCVFVFVLFWFFFSFCFLFCFVLFFSHAIQLGAVHIHGLLSTQQMHVSKIELMFIITTDCTDCGLFVFIKGVKSTQGFCNHLKMHAYPKLLSYKYTHINMS